VGRCPQTHPPWLCHWASRRAKFQLGITNIAKLLQLFLGSYDLDSGQFFFVVWASYNPLLGRTTSRVRCWTVSRLSHHSEPFGSSRTIQVRKVRYLTNWLSCWPQPKKLKKLVTQNLNRFETFQVSCVNEACKAEESIVASLNVNTSHLIIRSQTYSFSFFSFKSRNSHTATFPLRRMIFEFTRQFLSLRQQSLQKQLRHPYRPLIKQQKPFRQYCHYFY